MTTTKYLSRRGFIKATGGGAAAALLLTACAGQAPQQAAEPASPATSSAPATVGIRSLPASPPEVKTVSVGMDNPNYATQAIYWIAKAKGYFTEEGFENVDIITADEALQGVIGGSLTFANTDTDFIITAVLNNIPIRMISVHRDHEWQILGYGPDIKTPTDLKGKKGILGTPGTREYARNSRAIVAWSNGTINPDTDIENIEISGNSDAFNQALLSGQVSIAVQFPRHVKSIREAGGDIILGGWNEVPQEALATRQDFLQQNPNTVINFERALLKARAIWLDYSKRDEVIELLKATNQFNFREGFEEAYYIEPEQYSIHGGFNMQAMWNYLRSLSEFGIIPETVKYQDFCDLTALHTAQMQILGSQWPPKEDRSLLSLYQ